MTSLAKVHTLLGPGRAWPPRCSYNFLNLTDELVLAQVQVPLPLATTKIKIKVLQVVKGLSCFGTGHKTHACTVRCSIQSYSLGEWLSYWLFHDLKTFSGEEKKFPLKKLKNCGDFPSCSGQQGDTPHEKFFFVFLHELFRTCKKHKS